MSAPSAKKVNYLTNNVKRKENVQFWNSFNVAEKSLNVL